MKLKYFLQYSFNMLIQQVSARFLVNYNDSFRKKYSYALIKMKYNILNKKRKGVCQTHSSNYPKEKSWFELIKF